MSNYPLPQYGGGYGPPDQNNFPYVPPTYPNQFFQPGNSQSTLSPGNSNPSYGVYGYNRDLPGFNNTAVASNISPVPFFQGWNQEQLPHLPYSTAPSATPNPFNGYSNPAHLPPQYYQQSSQAPAYSYEPTSNSNPARPLDHGELSEGEYDESDVHVNQYPETFTRSNYKGSGERPGTGHQVTPYHEERPPSNHVHALTRTTSRTSRRGSDSYSPHISPVIQHASANLNSRPSSRYSNDNRRRTSDHKVQTPPGLTLNGFHQSTEANPSNKADNLTRSQAIVMSLKDAGNGGSGRSVVEGRVAEGRKKAKGAILNLWPYDVRFQTYIDEGFREDIISKLFDDLKMPRGDENIENRGAQFIRDAKSWPGKSKPVQSSAEHSASNGTEPPPSDANGLVVQVGSTSGTVSEVAKPLNEKERTIQAKMEALKKSREKRALNAAAQKGIKTTNAANPVSAKSSEPAVVKQIERVESVPVVANIALDSRPKQQDLETLSRTKSNPPAVTLPQQVTPIPGLFLATGLSPAASQDPSGGSKVSINQPTRKRPVASDFDSTPFPSVTPKRPFGHHRKDQTFVIDVSEDDESQDEDVEMDLDSEANQNSPPQSSRSLSAPRLGPYVESKALATSTPSKANNLISSAIPSTSSTPLGSSKLTALGRPADLQRKESQIEELKRRIAQAEARNKARQTPSGTHTPVPVSMSIPGLFTPSANTIEDTNTPARPASAMESTTTFTASRVENRPDEKLREPRGPHGENREPPNPEQTALQEVTIRSNAYEQLQKKLEALKAEMATVEAASREAREELNRAKERESRLRVQKELRLKLRSKLQAQSITSPSADTDTSSISAPAVDTPRESDGRGSPRVDNQLEQLPSPILKDQSLKLNENFADPSQSTTDLAAEQHPTTVNNDVEMVDGEEKTASESSEVPTDDGTAADRALEATLQEAIRAGAETPLVEEGEDIDMEKDELPKAVLQVPPKQQSEEPENVEEIHSPSNALEDQTSSLPDLEVEAADDNYQPPDSSPMAESLPSDLGPPIEHLSTSGDEQGQDDLLIISDSSSRDLVDVQQANSQPAQGAAPALVEVENATPTPFFTPYESPLRRFKAYRFHPEFQNTVAGGLRSITYSNKINPSQELCRFETAGGICNDQTCDLLHFRDMALPDDAILTTLGSPEQFKGGRYEEFCDGLRALLMDLRVRKIRDFNVIAPEILAFRTRFIGDESRVLPLEGVTV